jgi:hypothetical protein
MRFLRQFPGFPWTVVPLVTCTLLSYPLAAGSALAQSSVGIQTTLTEDDRAILDVLVQRAYTRSASIRELRTEQIVPLLESVEIEAQVSPNQETEIILQPINLLSGLFQQPALSARLREERAEIRAAVLEVYVAYLRARQASYLAQLTLEEATAEIAEPSVARGEESQLLVVTQHSTIPPAQRELAHNRDYVEAANELFTAQTDEIMALERLSGLVAMTPQETLATLTRYGDSQTARQISIPEP